MFDSAVAYVQGATGLVPDQTEAGAALFATDDVMNKTLLISVDEDGKTFASLGVPEANIAGLQINEERLWLVVIRDDGAYSCVKMLPMWRGFARVNLCVQLDSAPSWSMEATLALLVDALMRD